MNPMVSMLMCVALGAATPMMGMLIFRDAEQSFSSALKECVAWGTRFFFAMSIQVISISTL
jgi:hypothetical protein